MTTRRGTSNANQRGSSESRRRRREWLVATYRADSDLCPGAWACIGWSLPEAEHEHPLGDGLAACRCYRCGELLSVETVTVDRIIPGCQGGTYRRTNIRPACAGCNSSTGGRLAHRNRKAVAA